MPFNVFDDFMFPLFSPNLCFMNIPKFEKKQTNTINALREKPHFTRNFSYNPEKNTIYTNPLVNTTYILD